MTASRRNSRYLPKSPIPAIPDAPPPPFAHELNEDNGTGVAHYYQHHAHPQLQGEQPFVSGINQDQDEGSSFANQLGINSIDDRLNEPVMPGFLPPFSSPNLPIHPQSFFDPTHTVDFSFLNNYNYTCNTYNNYNHNNYNYNNYNNYNNFTNYTNISNPALAFQSFSASHYATEHFLPTDHVTYTSPDILYSSVSHTSSLAQTVQTPVLDSAIPSITADLDAMSIFNPAPGGLIPEAPAPDQVAMEINWLVDRAKKAEGRLLCPFDRCIRGLAGNPLRHAGDPRQKDGVSSKDSLRNHLRRIHFPPPLNERLRCLFDWCNITFGHTPELVRHLKQIHLGHGHWCLCSGRKWYARLDALKRGCRFGSECPGAIDYRETGFNA